MAEIKAKTIFDILNDLTFNKVKWEDQSETEQKKVQMWMINRWFSMHPDYLEVIAECQPTTDLLDTKLYYKFYLDLLPKKKFFTKYISNKSEKDKKFGKVINFLADKMQLSKDEAEQCLDILMELPSGLFEIKSFIKLYGYDDKGVKGEFGI
jgi:hypothetical protein